MSYVPGHSHSHEGLRPHLVTRSAAPVATEQLEGGASASACAPCSGQATLLGTWGEGAMMAAEAGVRPEKVAVVRASLAAGNYQVPASAVASRVLEYMLVR